MGAVGAPIPDNVGRPFSSLWCPACIGAEGRRPPVRRASRLTHARYWGADDGVPVYGPAEIEIGDVVEQALVQLVPLAVAAALSSVPLTATIFILLSDSGGRSGLAFLAGTVLGTFATVTVATVASQALPGRPRQHEALIGKLEIAIGIAMVLLGVVTLMRRQSAGRGSEPVGLTTSDRSDHSPC